MFMQDTQPRSRRNLVVVRAGKDSLHPQWLDAGQNRSWDLIVSLYEPEADFRHDDNVSVVRQRGGKWDGLYALFSQSDILNCYDYIWLPDDDIAAHSIDIDAMFDAMARLDLYVAQPSLTRDSYYTHFILLSCPGFKVRFTNFVETMVPCLKAGVLNQILEVFRDSMSGFGLDSIWCRLALEPFYKAAIFDEITVRHTRPVGANLLRKMAEGGLSAVVEGQVLLAQYKLTGKVRPLVYASINAKGRLRIGCKRHGLAMAFGYLSAYRQFTMQESASWKILQLLRRQFTERLDMSPLKRSPPTGSEDTGPAES
jgi:hypothetical protein